ncbi:hypothetical protein NY_014-165 [NY_014 poxvirus]|uniref:hypothetical protein n=1 Tax=NY_014 poxvirus TaxID=2025360 RepID=UPI000B99F692|nr:hypothetical protein CKM51_gp165 [NY_014 poxvirus]AST09566.1 hypothetical protein NY_014-165 [NY_014 poxvirus]
MLSVPSKYKDLLQEYYDIITSVPDEYRDIFVQYLIYLIEYDGRISNKRTRDIKKELINIVGKVSDKTRLMNFISFITESICRLTRFQSFLLELASYHDVLDEVQEIMGDIIKNHCRMEIIGFTAYDINSIVLSIIYNMLKTSGMRVDYDTSKVWWNPEYSDMFGSLYMIVTTLTILKNI